MRYQILHTTHYTYSQAVFLNHHVLRLRPRSDGSQQVHQFSIEVDPLPKLTTEYAEMNDTAALGVWFENTTTPYLKVRTISEVETCRTNPFDYLIEPWAAKLPVDYPQSIATLLAPYLAPVFNPAIAPDIIQLAQNILVEVDGNFSYFLTTLTQRIYDECTYIVREQGDPFPAGVTWQQRRGSCRDFAVVFVDACRAVGLAARFVSGYQEGDPDQATHDLHAWAEVYVPGGGWRGFDPTHGLAVADRHVAIATGPHPRLAAPVTGTLREGVQARSTLTTHISVKPMLS